MKTNFLILTVIAAAIFSDIRCEKVIVNNNTPFAIEGWSVYPGGTGVTCPSKNKRYITPGKQGDDQLSTTACTMAEVKFDMLKPDGAVRYKISRPLSRFPNSTDWDFDINLSCDL